MKVAYWLLGILSAAALHAGVVLFGGLIFASAEAGQRTHEEVELLSESDAAEEAKEDAKDLAEVDEATPDEDLETEVEEPPDASEMLRNLDLTPADAPALEAASLSAIEAALNGLGSGSGDFAEAVSFSSGGRIGGTGRIGDLDEKALESAFSLAEIDQRPRAVFQNAPLYPAEMRAKKVEGVVTLIFVIDATGKVTDPRVESSTHRAFEKPALDAVKQWKFEPAVKGGERVSCKMRAPIRFQPNAHP